MHIFIDEVIAEVEDTVTTPEETHPTPYQIPLSAPEAEIARTLALIRERQDRLKVD